MLMFVSCYDGIVSLTIGMTVSFRVEAFPSVPSVSYYSFISSASYYSEISSVSYTVYI